MTASDATTAPVAEATPAQPTLAELIAATEASFIAFNAVIRAVVPGTFDPDPASEDAASDAHEAAVVRLRAYEPQTLGELMDKADALNKPSGNVESDSRTNIEALVTDLAAILNAGPRHTPASPPESVSPSGADCPVAALMDELASLLDAQSDEHEASDWNGPAHTRIREIENMARRTLARSLKGAMFQVALANGVNDLMDAAGAAASEDQTDRDHRDIDLLTCSALLAMMEATGIKNHRATEYYAMSSYEWQLSRFASSPEVFDAADFIKQFEQLGGSLRLDFDENVHRVVMESLPPEGTKDEATAREMLSAVRAIPWKLDALSGELAARISDFDIYAFADWIAEFERLEEAKAVLPMPADGAPDAQHRAFELAFGMLDNRAGEMETNILSHATHSRQGAIAKLKVALSRMRKEGSVWTDQGDILAVKQVIAYLEREEQPKAVAQPAPPVSPPPASGPDHELVALARRFQANRDEYFSDGVDVRRQEALTEALAPILDRSFELQAQTVRGLWAKALMLEEYAPNRDTVEHEDLEWKVARSLYRDVIVLGERPGDPKSVDRAFGYTLDIEPTTVRAEIGMAAAS